MDSLEASIASLATSSSSEGEPPIDIQEDARDIEELTTEITEIEERLASAESSITSLNTKSENLDVTLLTICNRIDFLSNDEEDLTKQYHCCFNPDLQKMICGDRLAINIGAVEITPGTAGQCLATDNACL